MSSSGLIRCGPSIGRWRTSAKRCSKPPNNCSFADAAVYDEVGAACLPAVLFAAAFLAEAVLAAAFLGATFLGGRWVAAAGVLAGSAIARSCSSFMASCSRSTRIHRSGTRSRSLTKPKSS